LERNQSMTKFKIGYMGGDSHAGTINDMFQDSLPDHPLVESVDWEWTSRRWGFDARKAVGKSHVVSKLLEYDIIFQNPYELNDKDNPGLVEFFDANDIWKKVILYDVADEPGFHFERWRQKCLLYLKRAWDPIQLDALDIGKYPVDGQAVSRANLIPIDFPMFKEYVDVIPMNFYHKRDLAVTCTLPQTPLHNARGIVAHAVKNTHFEPVDGWISQVTLFYSSGWVLSSAATSYREILNPIPPQINWWYVYMHMLRRTQVLFGAGNHTAYGDHRTWEAFASGALVVTDRIPVDNPHNPEPGVHYIKFELDNIPKTMAIVNELLKDKTERERIAKAGFDHAVAYHSSDARIAYVMENAVKRLGAK